MRFSYILAITEKQTLNLCPSDRSKTVSCLNLIFFINQDDMFPGYLSVFMNCLYTLYTFLLEGLSFYQFIRKLGVLRTFALYQLRSKYPLPYLSPCFLAFKLFTKLAFDYTQYINLFIFFDFKTRVTFRKTFPILRWLKIHWHFHRFSSFKF